MSEILILRDDEAKSLFAVVTNVNGVLNFHGVNAAGDQWAKWVMSQSEGKASLESISDYVDYGIAIEGPKRITPELETTYAKYISLKSEMPDESASDWRARINFKALAYENEVNVATYVYEVKKSRTARRIAGAVIPGDAPSSVGEVARRALTPGGGRGGGRAVYFPDLGNGKPGYRCPEGTRYGGQITDRFGRNCGWGVARRLVNQVGDLAGRAEDRLDERRVRRVERRNRRMERRLARDEQRNNRTRRGEQLQLFDAEEVNKPRRRRRGERPKKPPVADRLDRFGDRMDGGAGRGRRRRRERRGSDPQKPAVTDRRNRRISDEEWEQRRQAERDGRRERRQEERDQRRERREQDRGQRQAARERRREDRRKRQAERAARRADAADRFADRVDGGFGRRRNRREAGARRRGVAERLDDFADRVLGGGDDSPADRERQRRTSGRVNRSRPRSEPRRSRDVERPAGDDPAGPKRRRGPFIDTDALSDEETERLTAELVEDLVNLNNEWVKRLGEQPSLEAIDAYIAERERDNRAPAYLGKLRAMRNDWVAFQEAIEARDNGDENAFKDLINKLGPARRKRVAKKAGIEFPKGRRRERPRSKPRSRTPDRPESDGGDGGRTPDADGGDDGGDDSPPSPPPLPQPSTPPNTPRTANNEKAAEDWEKALPALKRLFEVVDNDEGRLKLRDPKELRDRFDDIIKMSKKLEEYAKDAKTPELRKRWIDISEAYDRHADDWDRVIEKARKMQADERKKNRGEPESDSFWVRTINDLKANGDSNSLEMRKRLASNKKQDLEEDLSRLSRIDWLGDDEEQEITDYVNALDRRIKMIDDALDSLKPSNQANSSRSNRGRRQSSASGPKENTTGDGPPEEPDRLPIYNNLPKAEKPPILVGFGDNNGKKIAVVENPDIQTIDDAVKHVRARRPLSEVPNEFLFEAVLQNSSTLDVDANTGFKEVLKNGGNVGETRIFVVRDSKGAETQNGILFKAQRSLANPKEVISVEIAREMGIAYGRATFDGETEVMKYGAIETMRMMALPYAWNEFGGEAKGPFGYPNYDPSQFFQMDDLGAPHRVANLLFNWSTGQIDRHDQNGMSAVVDQNIAVAIPIDFGFASGGPEQRLLQYLRNEYDMDSSLFDDLEDHFNSLSSTEEGRDEIVEQVQTLIATYDGMAERAVKIVDEGLPAWMDRFSPEGGNFSTSERQDWENALRAFFRNFQDNASAWSDNRDDFIDALTLNLDDDVRERILNPSDLAASDRPSEEPPIRTPAAALPQLVDDPDAAKLGVRNKEGYAAVPIAVPVGSNGIDVQFDATEAVANGADLADIPDEFLAEAILNNFGGPNDRFERIGVGGGVNDAHQRFADKVTGKLIGVKFIDRLSYGIQEDRNEVVGAHMAERLGFAQGIMRFGARFEPTGDDRDVVPIVYELAQNVIGPDIVPMNGVAANSMNPQNVVRAMLLDAIIQNGDRNPNNYFVIDGPDGWMFVPIDHGLAFNGYTGVPMIDEQEDVEAIAEYVKKVGKYPAYVADWRARMRANQGRRDVLAEIREIQDDLRAQEEQYAARDAIQDILGLDANRAPVGGPLRDHLKAADRIQWLINADPEDVLRALISPEAFVP